MIYKAVIFDIDGTAVANAQYAKPSKRLIDVVQKAKMKAHICAATGRIWSTARWVIEPLQLTAPCVICAGAEIIDPVSQKIIWKKYMNKQQVSEVLQIARTYQYKTFCASELISYPKLTKLLLQDESIIIIDNIPIEEKEQIKKKLFSIPNIDIHEAPAYINGTVCFNITHVDATKFQALHELTVLLDIKKEEIIGVGDGDNDLPLFDSVGLKIAVGNATEKLKAAADEIVADADKDGLAQVIQKYIR